ncbi:Psi-producing oxygenase A [Grifola frondosa]|uniref:Psi-producing oxygenase A n=1 Tax=Grifola frondosa TaxID=5627 RepID=A0A1C7MQE2_GRIFR|nr:Psi-producing oxygenase A [Grifola frondosa]
MSRLVTLADANTLSDRPLPDAPDGRYDWQVKAVTETVDPSTVESPLHRMVSFVQTSVKQGPLIQDPLATASALLDVLQNQDAVDDRKGLFTQALSILCKIPQDSDISKKLNDALIAILYNTLPHPPCTYMGTNFPSAPTVSANKVALTVQDTQTNNPWDNRLRRACLSRSEAGTPYARSVQNKHPLPPNILPDTGLVFDTLLKARDFQPHPGRNSSLTFAYASLVTHQLFRTDPTDMTKNNTTSYLDLSVLYGTNQAEQDLVRDKDSGRGLLWPDAYSEDRLGFVPPAASALLVLFSRNHNYIAEMLLKLNERGRWTDPPPTDAGKLALQDEEIFQVARLVNCGHFMAMIFGDYVAGFLGLGRDGSSWSMQPFDPITQNNIPVSRGDGNCCSVEFNILYRWHPTTAQEDIKWTEAIFKDAFGDSKPLDQLELSDFMPGLAKEWRKVDPNPRTRCFADLTRGPDGRFSDDALAKVLQDATEKVAGTYRAPVGPCTMNEFRAFLGLKQFETFEEWSSDPEIADTARKLYGHIDNLELYPGLQAEDCMPLGPGSGICCGYTMTRAILSDAIALVRGDRYYTTDYTPANLTAWGFQDCARDPNNGAFGAALPKLLFRHLPRHYPQKSVYGLFPFFIPEVTRQNLTKLGLVDQYSFERPVAKPAHKTVETLPGIQSVLGDVKKFQTPYGENMRALTKGVGFFAAFDEKTARDKDQAAVLNALFPNQDSSTQCAFWFREKVQALIKESSFKLDGVAGTRVDIVGNVINLAPVYWVAELLMGIPLKTKSNPKGILTPQEVNDMLQLVFASIYLNVDPEYGWSLQQQASSYAQILREFIEKSLTEAVPSIVASSFTAITSLVFDSHKDLPWFLGYPSGDETS